MSLRDKTVRDAAIAWAFRQFGPELAFLFSGPVVASATTAPSTTSSAGTCTTSMSTRRSIPSAAAGGQAAPVAEGNVGGGTGMVCHEFKGGIGTASRRLPAEAGGYTVGVLVQANHGARHTLTIAGVPVGKEITDLLPEIATPTQQSALGKTSSIIVVVGTDAPLLPHQLDRLARRAALGIGLVGGRGEDPSGDIIMAFSTAHVLDIRSRPPSRSRPSHCS